MATIAKEEYFQAQERMRKAKDELENAIKDLDTAKENIKQNPGIPMKVSDHALVQWLQRICNMDISKKIADILNTCDQAGTGRPETRADGEQTVYETDGPNNTLLTMIVRDNVVVTCYINPKEPAIPDS